MATHFHALPRWVDLYEMIGDEFKVELSDDMKSFLSSNDLYENREMLTFVAERLIDYYESIEELTSVEELKAFIDLYNDLQKSLIDQEKAEGLEDYFCHHGCSKCCSQPIRATDLEVELLQKYCEENNITIDLERAAKQSKVLEKGFVSVKHWEEQLDPEERACIFLDTETGLCKAYEARPFNCRNYFAVGTNRYCGEDLTTISEEEALDAKLVRHFETAILSTFMINFQKRKSSIAWMVDKVLY